MRRTVRAIVTIGPIKFPDHVEVQALLLDQVDRLTGSGASSHPNPGTCGERVSPSVSLLWTMRNSRLREASLRSWARS